MEVIKTQLPEVLLIRPKVFGDGRGFFCETFSEARYREAGITLPFVQDNLSFSKRGTLRGLHLQHPNAQGKLVMVAQGEVLDVAVDVRVGSPTFGEWASAKLSGETLEQLWVPPGFAHGFCVLSDQALFSYKCTDFYSKEDELSVLWNDPEIGVEWPVDAPVLSDKDANAPRLSEIDLARLPQYPSSQHSSPQKKAP